jgi:phage terminase large subunit-like protein
MLAEAAALAKVSPGFYNDYLRYHLNRWVQQVKRWLSVERWKECDDVPPEAALELKADREASLRGRACNAGLDLSSKLDLTALVLAFLLPDGYVELICRFWLPENTIREQAKKGHTHYQTWAEQGWITATPGDVIDYAFIRAELNELRKTYKILEIAIDPHNAVQIGTELREQDGFETIDFQQGMLSMSEPSKAFEAKIVERKVRHGGNPVLRWMVGNAVVKRDAAGNIKPDKEKASGKIDGVVAAIMANGRANLGGGASAGSYLEEGPLLAL